MTTEEMIAVMQAYVDGEPIQVKSRLTEWEDFASCFNPSWDWRELTWRIKPAERKPREWRLVVDDGGRVHGGRTNERSSVLEVSNSVNLGQCSIVHVREVLDDNR